LSQEDQIIKAAINAANADAMICPCCGNDRSLDTKDWRTPLPECSYCRAFVSARRVRTRRAKKRLREHPLTREDLERAMAVATALEAAARRGEI
jgi:hypothetical protein